MTLGRALCALGLHRWRTAELQWVWGGFVAERRSCARRGCGAH